MGPASKHRLVIMNESAAGYLTGHLLVAMPQMEDPRFARTVIFLCSHTSDGTDVAGAILIALNIGAVGIGFVLFTVS